MSAAVESTLAKARALAAMIAPDSGASDGERQNAGAALARLLERHGLRLADLDSSKREPRSWFVRNRQLVNVAAQIVAVVTGDGTHPVGYRRTKSEIPQRGLKVKEVAGWEVLTDLTKAEYEDWRAMLWHYLPLYEATVAELNARAKAANLAKKKAFAGFAHKFRLFPPAKDRERKGRAPSLAELSAIMAAMSAAQGEAWKRPAARLTGGQ